MKNHILYKRGTCLTCEHDTDTNLRIGVGSESDPCNKCKNHDNQAKEIHYKPTNWFLQLEKSTLLLERFMAEVQTNTIIVDLFKEMKELMHLQTKAMVRQAEIMKLQSEAYADSHLAIKKEIRELINALNGGFEAIEIVVKRIKARQDSKYNGKVAPESRPYNDFSFINKDFVKVNGSTITFQIQDGPMKEFGKNGCQVDTIIEVAKGIVESFNKRFPCPENDRAILSLGESIAALAERKQNREKRGVEGHDKQ